MRPAAAGESWLEAAARRAAGAEGGLAARVLVAEVDGSAPREAGAAMLVDAAGAEGSIGGGALE
ncbi:MAG: XdhC family protein, partial [Pseudomonadota bacterium]